MLARMDSDELSEWEAYFGIEPWGEERADLRAGIIASVTASCHSGKRFKPGDFMPDFLQRSRRQSPKQIMQTFDMFFRTLQNINARKRRRGGEVSPAKQ